MMVVAAAVSAYSAYSQGQAAKKAGEFNAKVAQQNAEISRAQAAAQAQQTQRETFLRLGAIRAAQGASGGTMEGSALDVLGDVATQGELQRQQDIYRGEMQARGYNNTASLDLMRAKSAGQQGTLSAVGSLAQGAAGAAGAGSSVYGAMNTPKTATVSQNNVFQRQWGDE
jgi:hypothetical protein